MFGFGKKKVVKPQPIEALIQQAQPTGVDRIAQSLDSFVKAKEELIQGVDEVNSEREYNESQIDGLNAQNELLTTFESRALRSIDKLTEILGG